MKRSRQVALLVVGWWDCRHSLHWAPLMAQRRMNLPAMWETQVQSLGQEDPMEKGVATHSSIPAWRIPWTEEPGGLQFMGLQKAGHNWKTNTFTFIHTYSNKRSVSNDTSDYEPRVMIYPILCVSDSLKNKRWFWNMSKEQGFLKNDLADKKRN